MKRADAVIIAVVLLAAGVLLGRQALLSARGDRLIAEIYLEGKLHQTIPLTGERRELMIETEYGQNTLEIGAERVKIIAADCPTQECVRAAGIARAGQSVACLPHRLTVLITGGEEDYDAIAG